MRSLLKLLPYFARYKWKFIRGVLFVILSSAAQALWPMYLGRAIDSLSSGRATPESLIGNALFVIGFSGLSGFLYFLVRQNIIVASRQIEYDLRNDLLSHFEQLSMRFFQNTPQGDIMAYATNDIDAVRTFIGPAMMYSSDTIFTFILTFSFMLGISPWLSLATVLPLPLMSLGIYLIGKRIHPLFDAVQAHYASLTARTTESISGMRVVRAYVRETYEKNVFDKLSRGYFDKNMRLARVQGLMMPIMFSFMGFATVLLILVGGPMVMKGTLTIGNLAEFLVYLGMLTWPFIAVGWVTSMIQRSAASMARIVKIMELTPEIRNTEITNWNLPELRGDIEFNDVTLQYRPGAREALRNVSFKIPHGSSLAIMGRTGSGKTSIVNLLTRLYDPTSGSITIDGHDLRTIPIAQLRALAGVVTQEPFLFSETIEGNITFGANTEQATKLEVPPITNGGLTNLNGNANGLPSFIEHPPVVSALAEKAARNADIYDNVTEFPEQFHTMIGERGITLSGGQKQRTAIARAIARAPKILILDDAMSAVDTATEERILSNIRHLSGHFTTILISHRVSTVKDADRIIVLHEGEIIESGTHAELLELRGEYHSLYRKQLLEEFLEKA